MEQMERDTWQAYADAFAFLGNSLLATVRQTSEIGLDPAFWQAFPTFGDDQVAAACSEAARRVEGLRENTGIDPVTDASVEFTHLFVGPPKPAAAPWETMHRSDTEVGFGEATFQMQRLLADAGLQVENENNQYPDHMGIELLLLSVLCGRLAQSDDGQTDGRSGQIDALRRYVVEHPLGWVGSLRAAVEADSPHGYYAALLGVAEALLRTLG